MAAVNLTWVTRENHGNSEQWYAHLKAGQEDDLGSEPHTHTRHTRTHSQQIGKSSHNTKMKKVSLAVVSSCHQPPPPLLLEPSSKWDDYDGGDATT